MRTIPREVCLSQKVNFSLNHTQKCVLVGTLLGDGCIQLHGKNARLHIKHSLHQLPLVSYKHSIFSDITSMNVRTFSQKVGKKDYKFAEFVTRTHSEFTDYYRLFYPSFKKIIPSNIQTLLTDPLSLAVWIMDDGAAEYAGLSIQTHSFTVSDIDLLREVILGTFKLKTLRRKNRGSWIIYFPKESLDSLRKLISDHTLLEFMYKLEPYSLRQTP